MDLPQRGQRLTKDQEVNLLSLYRTTGDEFYLGQLIEANARLIMTAIGSANPPEWIDHEDIFAEIMPGVIVAIRRFHVGEARLCTYLYRVSKRMAYSAVAEMLRRVTDPLENEEELIDGSTENSPVDVIDRIRLIFNAIPDSQISEDGRKLLDRILRGLTITDISQQMGWGRQHTSQAVVEMRDEIAWRLVRNGISAEPWIPDHEIAGMAARHEQRASEWLWGEP